VTSLTLTAAARIPANQGRETSNAVFCCQPIRDDELSLLDQKNNAVPDDRAAL
jgi:hypothetical protein